MTHIDDDLASRLRATFDAVANTIDKPTTTDSHRSGTTQTLQLEPIADQNPRVARRSHAMLGVAAALAIGAVLAVAFIGMRDKEPAADAPPAWYQAIGPLLPPGYDHIAVTTANDKYVSFEALSLTSGVVLYFNVTRVPSNPDPSGGTITLHDAIAAPWSDAGIDHNIELPDGRQLGIYCLAVIVPEGRPGCPPDYSASSNPEPIRQFAIALARVNPADLPAPEATLAHVPTSDIRAAATDSLDLPESGTVGADHYGFSFVQYGDDSTLNQFVLVRTLAGLYPPLPDDENRRTASLSERRVTWQTTSNSTVWFVHDNPARNLDVAAMILDHAISHD